MTGSAVVKGVLSTLVDSMVSHIKMFTSSWKLYLSFVCCILVGGFHRAVGCGGRYTGSSGSISSPHYPGNYDNNLHCVYTIDAGETLITLVFEDFNTEKGYDVVKVYDSSDNLLVQLSGDRERVIVQSAVYYRVVFNTDGSTVRKGFKAVWTGCGGRYTGSSGSISSPNYPDNYDNNLHCTYIIDAGETLITLVFEDFNTQEWYDVVKVYDASNNLLVRLSGDRRGYIVQSAVYYRVVFTTDRSHVRKGFKAVWTVAKDSSARFGGYATLSWTLPEPGTREFSVCNSETKTCLLHITGYNDVRAASNKFTSRVRFTGNVSSSGTGLFRFVLSDVTWEDEGHYKCYRGSLGSGGPIISDCGQKLVVQGCGGRYTNSSGSISSPNYPGNYSNYLNCVYTIDAGETLVTLVFEDFSTEEWNDVVKVYDASNNLLATLRGDRQGYIVQSAVYYRVVFTTDQGYATKGFRAVWTVAKDSSARFGSYATLSWTLPEPGTREFSVCNSETKKCLLHITGYNDVRAASDKFTSRVRFIGNVSSSGTGLFRFVLSDVTWEDEGHYKCYRGSLGSGGPIIPDCGQKLVVQGCGGRYTGSSGSISSPNYPGNYNNSLHCVYTIDAGETLITLVFEDFNTEEVFDVVKVYDSSNNLLVQLSGDRRGYIVQSAVYYRVVFTTRRWRVRRGFRAVWTEAKDSSARFGGYAMLSWTLPDPGTREFSVCNSETKTCLLHITGYNDVRAASDKFTSRVRFIGHVSSSGTGLFRFVLSDVTWEDEGHYKCYRGSPGSGGPIISDCGQKLVVQDDAFIGDTVTLSCRLPQPAVREFTVWNSNWSIPLAHVTNFKDANIVSEVYRSRLTLRFHGKDLLILELEYVVLNDRGQFRCHTGTPDSIGSRIADCGQQLNVYAGAVVYARQGSNATLSWRLPQPAVREFTVRRYSSDITLFHVTNYNKVDITSTYRTRAEFTGNIDSSGSAVFSFLLYDVVWSDSGDYRCYRGSLGSRGDQMSDCGQELHVTYIQDPYIVALETVKNDSSVSLTCSSFTRTFYSYYYYNSYHYSYIPDVSFTWRKNGEQLETRGRYHLTVDRGWLLGYYYQFYYRSTLTISAVVEEGDRFTCQADRHQRLRTDWSEEYTLSRTWAKSYTDYTVVQEGDNATITWKMPLSGDWFYVKTPGGGLLLRVKSTDIYIWDRTYLSRVKITGVIRSTAAMVVRFTLYGVTTADAGKYYCHWGTICEHILVVSQRPYIVAPKGFLESERATLTCYTYCKGSESITPALSVTWRRNNKEVETGGRYAVSAPEQRHRDGFWTSTLDITGVKKTDTADRYSCQIVEKQGLKMDWSQEYIVGVNTWTESYTDNTVVREGNNATVTWKMPLFKVSITSPTGREVLTVKSTNIYISNSYWSRVKILGVTHLPDAVVVRFTLYNTKRDDVGRYYCTRARDGNPDSSCDQIIVVSPTLTRYDSPKSKSVIMSWNRKHVEGTFSILSYPAPKKHEILLLLGDSYLDQTDSPRHRLVSRRIADKNVLFEYTFSINNLRKEDLGTYNVTIYNGESSVTLSMYLLEPASRISLTMVIAIACTVVIVIASIVISILILVYKRLKNKEMSRRSALTYISAVQEAAAAAGRVYYSGYHVYADVDNSGIRDNIPGHRRASDSSSDDYNEVGQAIIAIHPQPEDQDQVQIADNQIPNIDVREPSQAQDSSRQASDKPDTPPIVESSLHISSREKSDTASATSATPYYLTATEDKTSPQPSSSKKPDTQGATSATPYYLTATEDKTSPQPSSSKKPDTPGATSATPYYLTATEDKTSPQPSSSKIADSASAASATPYYLTATSSSEKPYTASATSTTPHHLTDAGDECNPQPSLAEEPDTPMATSTPHYLADVVDESSPQPSSTENTDIPTATSAGPYYLTDTEDESSPQPSSYEKPDTPTATSTPHYLGDVVDESSPQPSSTEKPDAPTGTSAGPYYLTDSEDE